MAFDEEPLTAPQGPTASLATVKVLDFSRVLAGPYATMMLGDFGADVLKVEGPDGDETRHWVPPVDHAGRSTYFASVNRNKRSIVLDLNNEVDLRRARALAAEADVLVENFRPGVMAKFGLDYPSLQEINHRLVYCSITGFGDGAGAALPGYDLIVQAVGGLMSITGSADGEPSKAGVALVDVLTGMNAVIGIQAALRVREASGRGQRVQVNLLQSLLSALVNQASGAMATGRTPKRMGNAHPSIAPYESFSTGDGEIVLAVGNDRQFARLAQVLGAPDLLDDGRFRTNASRVQNRDALRKKIEGFLTQRTADEWSMSLGEASVPAGQVNDILEALELADRLGLEPIVEIGPRGKGYRSVANPIKLSDSPPQYRLAPPTMGDGSTEWTSTQ